MRSPLSANVWNGERFTFPTHINEFLVRREDAKATEAFLVRVPPGGATHLHHHPDMEQTFFFLSGRAELVGGPESPYPPVRCEVGSVIHLPIGVPHSVRALSEFEVCYLCVNAFPGDVPTEATSLAHAQAVVEHHAFQAGSERPSPGPGGERALLDLSELFTTFPPAGRPQAYSLAEVTLPPEAGASEYRVQTVGPFQLCVRVTPSRQARLSLAALDELVAGIELPPGVSFAISGSQSPLSVKLPCEGSDVDLLLVVGPACERPAEVSRWMAAVQARAARRGIKVSPGVVLDAWLQLPGFYEVLGFSSPEERRWWSASAQETLAEATARLRRAEAVVASHEAVEDILEQTLRRFGLEDLRSSVASFSVTPRWRSIDAEQLMGRLKGGA
jgi:quercetin dioxygenase-like cupin family protein